MAKELLFSTNARERLQTLHAHIDSQIEAMLLEEKFVPGESVIEVTERDIREMEQALRFDVRKRTRSAPFAQLITSVYIVVGVLFSVAGFVYPRLQEIVVDTTQVTLILLGIVLMVFGFVGRQWFLYRDLRREEYERRLRSHFDPERDI